MNVKLVLGIALFLIGIVTAVFGIVGVGQGADRPLIQAEEATTHDDVAQTFRTFVLPAVAALTLATGAVLMGLSMGNWKNPRTHLEPGDEIVDPEGYQKMKHV
jgi:hypothetical protein